MSTLASLAALASDVLSVTGVPGGTLLEDVTKRLIDRRIAQAREILLDEIRRGEKHISQAGADDEFAAILFRYASFPVDLQSITLTALVSAASTVSVRLHNGTASGIDLGSGTLRVRVEKS